MIGKYRKGMEEMIAALENDIKDLDPSEFEARSLLTYLKGCLEIPMCVLFATQIPDERNDAASYKEYKELQASDK